MVFKCSMEASSQSSRAPFTWAAASFCLSHLLSSQSKILLGSWDRCWWHKRALTHLHTGLKAHGLPGGAGRCSFSPLSPPSSFSKISLGKALNTKEIRTLLCMCHHVVVFYCPGVAREVLRVYGRRTGKWQGQEGPKHNSFWEWVVLRSVEESCTVVHSEFWF